jgi:hypothetical protein
VCACAHVADAPHNKDRLGVSFIVVLSLKQIKFARGGSTEAQGNADTDAELRSSCVCEKPVTSICKINTQKSTDGNVCCFTDKRFTKIQSASLPAAYLVSLDKHCVDHVSILLYLRWHRVVHNVPFNGTNAIEAIEHVEKRHALV